MEHTGNPLVSVIIPVYNVERFLAQCLDSVIHQTYRDLEIICVNDGSKDGSLNILKHYASLDGRIVIIDQENAGQSVARNVALNIASGEYIIFLDSDDWWDRDTLELLVDRAEREQLDMLLFSSLTFCDGSETEEEIDPYLNYKSFLPEKIINRPFTWLELKNSPQVLWRLPVATWDCLYRHSYINNPKLLFADGLKFEDNLFFHRAILRGGLVECFTKFFYHQRKHPASTTANRSLYYCDQCSVRLLEYEMIKKLEDESLLAGYVAYCAIPQLWYELLLAPFREQRRHFELFKETTLKLIENRVPSELWEKGADFPYQIVELIQQNAGSKGLDDYQIQTSLLPLSEKSRFRLILNEESHRDFSFIIFCNRKEDYLPKLARIRSEYSGNIEIFCLFLRPATSGIENEIMSFVAERTHPMEIYSFECNRENWVGLVNNIIGSCSGAYINFQDEFSELPSSFDSDDFLSGADVIVEESEQKATRELALPDLVNDLTACFFKSDFLRDKEIRWASSATSAATKFVIDTFYQAHKIISYHSSRGEMVHSATYPAFMWSDLPFRGVCQELLDEWRFFLTNNPNSKQRVNFLSSHILPIFQERWRACSLDELNACMDCITEVVTQLIDASELNSVLPYLDQETAWIVKICLASQSQLKSLRRALRLSSWSFSSKKRKLMRRVRGLAKYCR